MHVSVAALHTVFPPIKLQAFISFPVSQTWQYVSNQKTGLYEGAYSGEAFIQGNIVCVCVCVHVCTSVLKNQCSLINWALITLKPPYSF